MKRADYINLFKGAGGTGRQKQALLLAHDIRKFEIELYWKRATYFWAFIAVAFAGFFATGNQPDLSNAYAIACLGFLFSLGWYLVNRASSAWQRNWEVHVDLLEDEITGPLHKAIVNRGDFSFRDFLGPYSYSPSRLNTALSLILVVAWVALVAKTALRMDAAGNSGTVLAFTALALVAAVMMLFLCLSGRSEDVSDVEATVRKYA